MRANPLRMPGEGQQTDADRPESTPGEVVDLPWADMDRSEQTERLAEAMRQLPAGEREVILLRHYTDLSFREIAEVMGTPLGTALARGHRGLARLRTILGQA